MFLKTLDQKPSMRTTDFILFFTLANEPIDLVKGALGKSGFQPFQTLRLLGDKKYPSFKTERLGHGW